MRKIFLMVFGIFLINLVSGISICIDHVSPSAPLNLILTASGNNIQLSWSPATDEPACSGISHYDIYRGKDGGDLILINDSKDTNYLDENLDYGTYIYVVHAWDLAGHNEGNGASNSIILKLENGNNGNGGSSSGGGGSSNGGSSSYWQCGKWSECINKTQDRVCVDLKEKSPNITETKTCFSDFIPIVYETNDSESNLNESTTTTGTGFLTGAVTGITKFAKSGKGVSLIFVILFAGLFAFFNIYKRKGKSEVKEEDSF